MPPLRDDLRKRHEGFMSQVRRFDEGASAAQRRRERPSTIDRHEAGIARRRVVACRTRAATRSPQRRSPAATRCR